jgi:hypothetical protein
MLDVCEHAGKSACLPALYQGGYLNFNTWFIKNGSII